MQDKRDKVVLGPLPASFLRLGIGYVTDQKPDEK